MSYKRKYTQESEDSIANLYYEKETCFKRAKTEQDENIKIENSKDEVTFCSDQSEVEEKSELKSLNKTNDSIKIERTDHNQLFESTNVSGDKIFEEFDANFELFKISESINLIKNNDELRSTIDKLMNSLSAKEAIRKNCSLFTAFEVQNKKNMLYNFEMIISTVLTENEKLFSDQEKELVHQFQEFGKETKTLLMLLLFKKNRWAFVDSLNSFKKENAKNLLKDLTNCGLLIDSDGLKTLEEALHILSVDDAKQFADACKITGDRKTKAKVIDLILNDTNKTKSSFPNQNNIEEIRLKNLKEHLKHKCFKVNYDKSKVFFKIFLLYFQPPIFDKEVYNYYLTLIHSLNNEEFNSKFADKNLDTSTVLYTEPKDLDDFVDACLIQLNLCERSVDEDLSSYLKNDLLNLYEKYVNSNYLIDIKLPDFLRQFKAGNRLIECIYFVTSQFIDQEYYKESIICLKFLIQQEFYCAEKISDFFNDLLIILDQVEEYQEALKYCDQALANKNVKNGLKVRFLGKKLEFVAKLNNQEYKSQSDLSHKIGTKNLNLSREFEEQKEKNKEHKKSVSDSTVVEEIAVNYYLDESNYKQDEIVFEECLRGQEKIFDLIFFNLFYDEIFVDISNVFKYRFQKYPLDFDSNSFIRNRKKLIDLKFQKLNEIRTLKSLCNIILDARKHKKCLKFTTKFNSICFENLKQIIYNIGKEKLMIILHYLVDNYASCSQKSPNFILWNDEKRIIKFVEVKSFDSYLDEEKILWLSILNKIGFNVEVLNVETD